MSLTSFILHYFQRYTEIQKKLEEYEEQDVEAKVMELSALAERKHATIKQKVRRSFTQILSCPKHCLSSPQINCFRV